MTEDEGLTDWQLTIPEVIIMGLLLACLVALAFLVAAETWL